MAPTQRVALSSASCAHVSVHDGLAIGLVEWYAAAAAVARTVAVDRLIDLRVHRQRDPIFLFLFGVPFGVPCPMRHGGGVGTVLGHLTAENRVQQQLYVQQLFMVEAVLSVWRPRV